jgi:PKD domain-containing protein/glucodextranase-like protein
MIESGLKLLTREHSWRLRPHRHTSYPALVFLLVMTAVVLGGMSAGALAAPPVVNPQSGSVGLTGTVPGPPPSQAAVITSPLAGDHTSTSPITISGTCPDNTFVFINKNNVLAGEATCNNGHFSLQADLFVGTNELVARVVDGLGQFGPDSVAVLVTFDQPTSGVNIVAVGRQLFLESDATVVAGDPGTNISRTISIVGGTAPYAVSWDFGDGTTSLMTVTTEGPLSINHTYTSPGTYRVIARVSDAGNNAAYIQLITVVNGPVAAVTGASSKSGELPGELLAAWPLLIFAMMLVIAFWLGGRWSTRRLALRSRLAIQS